jgi:Flp pilus assembly protein TadD
MSAPEVTATKPRVVGLVAIIVVVIAALTMLDRFLEKIEQAELEHSAKSFYLEGSRLLKAGKASQAVDVLRRAHSLNRQDENYELELITALMAAGKIDEADPLMREILERQPNDGRANLIAARLSLKKGRTAEAESYYHRAIYGEWPIGAGTAQGGNGTARNRMSVRMELIDLLVKAGKKQELLAELLPLEEEAENDPEIERKLGHLFLVAGSPSRAANVYHRLIQKQARDADAYAGLGEAELEQGRYREAKAAFITAYLHKPGDVSIRERMQLSNTMTALEPTRRQLSSAEKYRRSLHILDLSRASLEACLKNRPAGRSSEAGELLGAAQEALSSKPPAQVTNELAEQTLGLAERLWQARMKACGATISAEEEPLGLIMARLAQ